MNEELVADKDLTVNIGGESYRLLYYQDLQQIVVPAIYKYIDGDSIKEVDFVMDLTTKWAHFKLDNTSCGMFQFNYKETGFKGKNKETIPNAIKEVRVKDIENTLDDAFWNQFSFHMAQNYRQFQKEEQLVEVPLVQQLKNEEDPLLMEFVCTIQKDFDIKVIDNDDKDDIVYHLIDNSYQRLTKSKLKTRIIDEYGLRLPPASINKILKSFDTYAVPEDNYWEFADGYYLNVDTYEFEHFDEPKFTSKKVSLNGKLIPYIPNVQYTDAPIRDNKKKRKRTLIERTLRQITIPKDNQSDKSLYIDTLERIGSSFYPINRMKKITQWQGSGDDGKTTLLAILRTIFGVNYRSIPAKKFDNDSFVLSYIADHNVIAIDEINDTSFRHNSDIIKLITNGDEGISDRGLYETPKELRFGNLFIGSNIPPNLEDVDNAFLKRYDILEMPNKFVLNPTEDNEYKIDSSLIPKLKQDFDGIAWLVNASIQAFKQTFDSRGEPTKYTCSQSAHETYELYKSRNNLKYFLRTITEPADNKYIDNTVLLEMYIDFCETDNLNPGINIKNIDSALTILGATLKDIYGEMKKKRVSDGDGGKNTAYPLRIVPYDAKKFDWKYTW